MPKTRKIETEVTPGAASGAPATVRRRAAAAPRKASAKRAAQTGGAFEAPAPETVAAIVEPAGVEIVEVETVVVEAIALDPATLEPFELEAAAAGPTHEEISALAYSYWVNRGYQAGSPREDWLRAERELRQRA